MKRISLQILFSFLAVALLQAEANPSQNDGRRIVFTTISGPVRNAVIYAPNPVLRTSSLPRDFSAHGVFKMDLDSGSPYDVRVIQSTGSKILDDAAVETLRTWRFVPHRLTWVTIPIEFHAQDRPPVGPNGQAAKAIVIYAPKPEYPLEARTRHLTGSGIIMLNVDVASGEVTKAYMVQSMGHKILDDAALSAFRRWRFQPGKAAPKVKIPIRYSMNGTTY